MKPLLACGCCLENLRYPVLASPKLDGVRCIIIGGVAMSRNMKPIPNEHVQKLFGRKALNGLDGELVVGSPTAPDCFNTTMSGVMSRDGEPDVQFHVFDAVGPAKFSERLEYAMYRIWRASAGRIGTLNSVEHITIRNREELDVYEEEQVQLGYEGIMLRDPDGGYKHGRSTVKEGILMKVKRFDDAECLVVGASEEMANTNEQTRDELGRSKRSKHKAGMVGKGTLGLLHVMDLKSGVFFDIGTGFDAATRAALWSAYRADLADGYGSSMPAADLIKKPGHLLGRISTYKHQPAGKKDKPRFPVWKGFRDARDA